jgi:hypothetical protein
MVKLKSITVEGEKFFFHLSFDIDDFIGDGIWRLQIYDDEKRLVYDEPFASSIGIGKRNNLEIAKTIKNNFLTYRGALL